MASDLIGVFDFIRVDGEVPRPRQTHADITRPGADGIGLHLLGRRSWVGRLRGIRDFADVAAAETARALYYAAVDTVVSVTTQGGGVVTLGIVILDVRADILETAPVAVGGIVGGPVLMVSEWTVQSVLI